MIELTDAYDIRTHLLGKVFFMVNRAGATDTYLDEGDCADIAYDVGFRGHVKVWKNDNGRISVEYMYTPCTLTEIDVSPTKYEFLEFQALVRRICTPWDGAIAFDTQFIEAQSDQPETYEVELCVGLGEYIIRCTFDGSTHEVSMNGVARAATYEEMKAHLRALIPYP